MLHIVKPDGRPKRGRQRYLLVNPPIEEPYLLHSRPDAAGGAGAAQAADGSPAMSIQGRNYPYPLPLGLRYEEIRRILQNVEADEVLVGCAFTYHNEPAHRVIQLCKRRLGGVRVRLGGIYPTLAPGVARTSLADEVFEGPYPGVSHQRLNYELLGVRPNFILIKGTSGCPRRCAYCAVHKLEGNRFTHRDPVDVFGEIRASHQRYGLGEVAFWDSNILMQYEQYLGVILRMIVQEGLKLRPAAPEGLDYRLMTPQDAHDLKAAGLRTVYLALENVDSSMAQQSLNRCNDLELLKAAIEMLKAAGFAGPHIRLFVIAGLPGQGIQNVIDNVRFVWSLGCNIMLFPFTPIPGTPLYAACDQRLRDLPLKAMHPTLYPCVSDEQTTDLLVPLPTLRHLNTARTSQAEHFRQVITSPELLGLLG